MEVDRYNVLNRGRSFGPYTKEELRQLVDEGEFPLSAICLRIGDSEGIRRLEEIFPEWFHSEEVEDLGEDEAEGEIEEDWDEVSHEEEDSYEEEAGADDEDSVDMDQIIMAMHPHFLSYPRMLALVLTLLLLLLGAGFWAAHQEDDRGWGIVLPIGLIFLTALGWMIFLRSRDDYFVTRSRVEAVWGLIARSSKEVRIEDIRRIDVDKDGILGLIGIGNVEFSSSGTGGFDVAFTRIWRAHRVKGVIRRIMKNPDASRRYLLHGKKFWIGSRE